ncbi:MAG: S26 family signal peptidase, partial [Caulobacter sp.]
MTDAADDFTPPEEKGVVAELIEIVKTVAYALGIALVLRVLLFQPFTIPSASMEPNLYQGD